jgi:hypothetical protein
MRGIFSIPMLMGAMEVAKLLMQSKDSEKDSTAQWMAKAAPNVAELVLGKIPGLNYIAKPVSEAIKGITGVLGMRGANDNSNIWARAIANANAAHRTAIKTKTLHNIHPEYEFDLPEHEEEKE